VQTALACGVPVAASAVGAMPEMLAEVDGERARLVPPEDPAALAAALDALLAADDGEPARARRAAASRRQFAWEHPAAALLDTYRRLLAAREGGR
jgi:starch synthase